MAWTPPTEIITVDFKGTRFDGLTVKVEDVETADLLTMIRLSEDSKNDSDGMGSAAFDQLITMAADMIVEWDMEVPAGNPLPPTRESLGKLKQRVALPLIMMIIEAVQDIGDDVKKGSASGAPSPEASLPMAPL